MNGFQKIILFAAIIILIVTLVIIGISLSYAKNNLTWPPNTPECPDYWIMDGSGNNSNCINMKNLGTCPPKGNNKHLVMNFNLPVFTGSQGNCNKYIWSNKCGISWEGITYGVNNPCQTSS